MSHTVNTPPNTAQQTHNIRITFVQGWTNVEDVRPALYKCYTNVLGLLGTCCAGFQLK